MICINQKNHFWISRKKRHFSLNATAFYSKCAPQILSDHLSPQHPKRKPGKVREGMTKTSLALWRFGFVFRPKANPKRRQGESL